MGYALTGSRAEPGVEEREAVQALRRCAERMGARAGLLPKQDRALLEAIFVDGRSRRQLARLLGSTPRSVRRRIQRLTRRMESPKFVFVAAHLEQMGPTRRRIAAACVLHGLSLRGAAATLGMPINAVRHHSVAVHAMFEAAGRLREEPAR